jgi:hypothetical protein
LFNYKLLFMKRILFLFLFSLLLGANSQAQLIINEVLYDPSNTLLEGDANGDGFYDQTQDEFIEFVNIGASSLNLSGYQIWDDTLVGTLVYTIPNGTILPPQGALVIFGGGKPVGLFGGALVLADTGVSGLSLNNSGEVIVIKDNTGKTILTFDSDALSNNPNESYTRNPDLTGAFVQHTTVNISKFTPGRKVNGSSFISTPSKQISFKIDVNALNTLVDSVFVVGNFNQYCNTCNPLTDANKDGLWELTLPLSNDTLTYKFAYKSIANYVQEQFTSASICTKFEGATIYRYSQVKADSILSNVCFESCARCINQLSLKGITDFITPTAGSSGKAIYLVANEAIPNLSIYGLGIANNGGGTDGQEYRFPNLAVPQGGQIILARDTAALATYMSSCWSKFTVVLVDTLGVVNQNGDDAIELFRVGESVETFGNVNVDGSGEDWEYTGSWAYKNSTGNWIVGEVNCTDSSTTIFDADCIFPICLGAKVSAIVVSGQNNDSAITQKNGTLQMLANVLPTDAENKDVTWSVNNAGVANISATGLLTALNNGTVIVKATAKDGSSIEGSKSIVITGQSIGLETLQKSSIQIYPNPVSSNLNINSNESIETYAIYSVQGKLLKEGQVIAQHVDMSNLQPGIYLIDLSVNSQWVRYKVVKN